VEVTVRGLRLSRYLVLLFVVGAWPAAGWADQDHRGDAEMTSRTDVGAGFTMQTPADVNQPPLCQDLALPCGTPRTFPDLGGSVSIATSIIRSAAVVAEASVFDNLWYSSFGSGGRQHNVVRTLMAGVRASVRPPAVGGGKAVGVRLFGQILAGHEWSTELAARRAIQPGAGVDARFAGNRVVRIELDYRAVPGPGRNLSGSRVFIGMVRGFGSRQP